MRNRDETEAVYAAYDDLFLFTIADGTVRRLTDTDTTERNPHFVLDEQSVAFERDQNLFIVELDTGAVRQVTNFRTGPDPDADPDQTQLQAYLERQQTELFEYVRKTERLEEERDERRDAERGFRVAAPLPESGATRIRPASLTGRPVRHLHSRGPAGVSGRAGRGDAALCHLERVCRDAAPGRRGPWRRWW